MSQPLTRGQWTQVGSAPLSSALWTANGSEHFLNRTALTAGQTLQQAAGGSSDPRTLFAYSGGGAYDSTRQRWVFCCSTGHGSGGTNEVNELDLATGVWNPDGRPVDPPVGLLEPVTVPWPPGTCSGVASTPRYVLDVDNLYPTHCTVSNQGGLRAWPLPRQQYGGMVYMPTVQKFFLFGGYGYWAATAQADMLFEYTPATRTYQLIDSEGVLDPTSWASQVLCAWDSDQSRVLIHTGHDLKAYYPSRPAGSRMVTLITDDSGAARGHLFYDATRRRAVILCIGGLGPNAGLYYQCAPSGAVVGSRIAFTVTGVALPSGLGPGVFHDPVADRYVYFKNGQTLTFIDPVTFAATEQTFGGAVPPTFDYTASTSVIYHRWFYHAPTDTYMFAVPTVTSPGLMVFAPVRGKQVGPTRALTTAAAAQAVAADGDRIEIDAATYVNDIVTWTQKNLTIVGVGGTPLFESTTSVGEDFTWRLLGATPTLDNLKFVGMHGNGGSAAAIKWSAQNGLTTLRRLDIQGNDMGILGDLNMVNAELLLEDCVFDRNGDGSGQSHNIYIGDVDSVTMRGGGSHRALGGHLIKSRAKVTLIDRVDLTDGPSIDPGSGGASFEANFPNGGVVTIQDSLLEKGPDAQNFVMVRYGETAIGPPGPLSAPLYARNEFHSFRNRYVNDAGVHESSLFLDLKYARIPTVSESVDDTFVGGGTLAAGPLTVTTTSPRKFTVGQTVSPTTLLNVRNKPGPPPWTAKTDKPLGTQPKGALAAVLDGPLAADSAVWWQLDYATGVDGWSSEEFLVTAPPPPVADYLFTVPSGKTYSINGGPILVAP